MNLADRITLTGLRASAFHGVLAHERANGQLFLIDVVVHLSLREAGAHDELAETIDYGDLATRIVSAVERDPVDLIETVAERVAGLVLEDPLAMMVEVTVHKPSAPITVPFDDVSVTITRGRVA
ncbi:MAG TPA: dihydroneopterin aldolase [Pseudolysinimonas sp.]|nr:dihydroneopterin aldolase [Pseudolysinimonas sp.]